jgi:DNA-directed RNA polymerase subunit H (RpoH/RPB5)
MESKSNYLIQLYKARTNIISHLTHAGFDCDLYNGFNLEELDVIQKYEQLNFKVTNTKTDEQCYVYHLLDGNNSKKKGTSNLLKKSNIPDIVDEIYNITAILNKNDTLIIITTDYSVDSIHESIKNLWENDHLYVVVYNLKQLQINPIKHVLVPNHTRLTNQEKKEIFRKYNIERDSQLPQISRFDPIAKILLMRPGEICKIERFEKSSFNTDYYRICIS